MTEQQQVELNEALNEAAFRGHTEVCRLLIERGANVNAVYYGGWTPLHQAARYGYVDVCRLLIQAKSNVNSVDHNGETPLHCAARYGHIEVCRLLLGRGANVNATNWFGWTPLHLAAFNGHFEVCRLLIGRGADVHATNWFGRTPLDLAIDNHAVGVLVYFYVHRVADFHQPDHTGQKPWDWLTAEQQETLTKAMAEHQEKIGILQTRGLPIELARLVMGYL